jgi:hypothetical protein
MSAQGRATTQKAPASPKAPAGKKAPAALPWTQWGGPHRNFHTEASGLKDTWPAGGPRVMWKRPLGEGYSSVAVENDVVYTMYGKPREEVVLAANAETGATLWEHATPMAFKSDAGADMGNGPYATPLIIGNRLFTSGVAGRLQCLDKASGKVLWTQQLWTDHGGSKLMYGYASSPIAFRDMVILPVGGRGKSVMAFNQADGKVVWGRHDYGNVYSSPLHINLGGLEQTVLLMDGALIAVNPHNGDLQWQVPFKADYSIAIATPVWGDVNLMLVSGDFNAGAKVIGSSVRAPRRSPRSCGARRVCGSTMAMPFESATRFTSRAAAKEPADSERGRHPQRQRALAGTQHREGELRLGRSAHHARWSGTLMRRSLTQGSRSRRRRRCSPSCPGRRTLVGTRLYIRDRRDMMAVDLS